MNIIQNSGNPESLERLPLNRITKAFIKVLGTTLLWCPFCILPSTIMAFLMVFCGLYVIKITYQFVIDKCWYIILAYFFAVLCGDFIASKIGPKFNKKLAPEISPNKTIGGAIANLITSCIICSLLVFVVNFSILECLFFGFIISIFAQIGDLAISSIKRDMGIKHSGTMFLEYGGILDRMDAFIFSAPAAYYCLCLIS